jgi:hypothetical protein
MIGTDTGTAWDYTVNYTGGVQSLDFVSSGVILNDDTQVVTNLPTLTIAPSSSPSIKEGNSGYTPITYTVTRTGDLSATSSVSWGVIGYGTNQADAHDFSGGVLPSGAVTFAAGQSTATVTVNISGDTTFEPDEGYVIMLVNPVGAQLGTTSSSSSLTKSVSGGYGVTENFYTLGGNNGTFKLDYNMYTIPDEADIYVNSALVSHTTGQVSGTGTLTVPSTTALHAGDIVKVVMIGTDTGTAWDYTVNYTGGVQSLDFVSSGVILNDDIVTASNANFIG